ncbi:arylsulfatase [Brachybacterium ginsengisoli]|uniref:Arylsulfatase n=1 Tax=Brachybacterium ginsengisoli TaxID=1331682 RepID=A0A291H0S1_9MICO|nr:sulfatase-like hydrolase/transferase [Brachybacterium ginsengisoli]ATG55956.1 arylsulfatase [Brachybacterium ginsengisoli]
MATSSDARRPHIVLIVSDDHGFGDLGFRGIDPEVSTPHLDALAAEGRVFDNAYVTAPICSPSRAGLITGVHQARWGAHWFTDSAMAPEQISTLPERLLEGGYRTGCFGKIHYGADEPGSRSCPPRHGFETSFYGLAAQSMGRLHYLHHSRAHEQAYGEAAARHGVSPMWEGEERVDCERHLTEEFVERAIDFVDAPDERPFFAMVAFNAVHNFAWQLPQHELDARGLPQHPDFDAETSEYLDWYDGAVEPNLDNGRQYYLAQLEIMDREIGRLRAHLETAGLAENTIVIYMTDNGGSRCNYGRNTPLEGSKYTLFEGGVRTPMLISWPGVTEPGSVSRALVSSLDLTPTLLAAAGLEPREGDVGDGIDLRESCEDPTAPVHEVLHTDCTFQWSVRTPQWKLRYVDPDSAVRRSILQVEHTDIGQGLQLSPATATLAGIDETVDLAAQHPEVVRELTALHEAWRAEVDESARQLASARP